MPSQPVDSSHLELVQLKPWSASLGVSHITKKMHTVKQEPWENGAELSGFVVDRLSSVAC